jgi:hypothetical protein
MKDERKRFLTKEWPLVAATIARLHLDTAELLDAAEKLKQDASGDNDE